jgi:hypothetical protein
MAKLLACRGLRIAAIPHTAGDKALPPGRRREGALIFELYGPRDTDWLNPERLVDLRNESGRWRFDQRGTPLDFEAPDCYSARRPLERFSFALLRNYAAHMGLRPFEETFYVPSGAAAQLVEEVGPEHPDAKHYSLEEAQAGVAH